MSFRVIQVQKLTFSGRSADISSGLRGTQAARLIIVPRETNSGPWIPGARPGGHLLLASTELSNISEK